MRKKTKHGLPLMDIDKSEASCEGWSACRLMEIAVIRGGKRLPAGEQFSEEETSFPYIRVTDMVNGTINDRKLVYVKSDIEPLIRNYKISSQDLYVTIAGTLGQFGRIPEHLDGAQLTENAAKITKIDTSRVDINFLCHYLRSEQVSKLVDIATGTGGGVPKLPLYQIEQFLIQHPSMPEQAKIAEILSTVDRAIEQTEALIAKQQRIKTGLMQDLLTRGIDEHGNLRSEETHQFKDSPLGRIPVEWEVRTLAQCSHRVVVGLALSTTHAYRDVGTPMIRNQNIRKGYFDDWDMLYLDPIFAALFPNKATREGDVLTVRTGANVGDTAMVPSKYVGSPTFTTLITSTKNEVLFPEYLVWYIENQFGQSELNRIMVGGGKENLNVGQFVHFRIVLPPLSEQKVAVECLKGIRSRLDVEKDTLEKYHKIKTGLMQDLLTGKVRVSLLLTEPQEATV